MLPEAGHAVAGVGAVPRDGFRGIPTNLVLGVFRPDSYLSQTLSLGVTPR